MFLSNRFVRIAIILVAAVLSIFLLGLNYLTVDKRIPANILVVEGWMPVAGLEKAFEEFVQGGYDMIFLTGSDLGDHLTLYVNSFLIVIPHDDVLLTDSWQHHYFEIEIASSLGSRDTARMVFWVNDQPVEAFLTSSQQERFVVRWERTLPAPDSIMIQFVNDQANHQGDRNLIIRKLIVNGQAINHQTASFFLDQGAPFGRHRRNITGGSHAAMAAHFFADKGIPARKVIPVPNSDQSVRRTYGNALALEKWLRRHPCKITGVNVVSLDHHSRRSWLTYRKVLARHTQVGIIPVENDPSGVSLLEKTGKDVREALALIYYYLFLLPWERN